MQMQQDMVMQVKSLKKYFPIEKGFLRRVSGYVKAVDGVSFHIKRGEAVGLVGESGCGKTTLGRCILRALRPTDGQVFFRKRDEEVVDLAQLDKGSLRMMRKDLQMIFQDPFSALDPRMTVLDIIGEPLWAQNIRGQEMEERVRELAEVVGLNDKHLNRYPNAFSGGQRQRIGIARALATNPRFIVADEPVSALDVSIQAQILNLLKDLQSQFDLTYLFIAHNLSVVEHITDRMIVMYVGKVVELGGTERIFANPLHPYTEALLSAVPQPDPRVEIEQIILQGEVASPVNPPSGCYFHPRCRYAQDICIDQEPPLREIEPEHQAACHFAEELDLQGVMV